MRTIRGFKIKNRILRVSTWILRKKPDPSTRLHSTRPGFKLRQIDKLRSWGQRLTQSFKLFGSTRGSGYTPVVQKQPDPVPRGYLAVYVGLKDDDFHRVLVPIVYFNHPLFGELLKESEKEYGFRHEGGITLPCRYADFERVQTRIASGSSSRIFPLSCLCRN